MTIRKRRKSSRYPGTRSHGRGHKNRTRGSGNRGGVGMSGTGKRGDQKKTLVIKLHGGDYFGKDKALRTKRRVRLQTITLRTIVDNIHSFVRKGMGKPITGGYELTLKSYKLIGSDSVPFKLVAHVAAASKGSQAAVESAGGSVQVRTEADQA